MTTPKTSDAVELEVRVAAQPETVFSFLRDGPGMARWFGRQVELDARPGGSLRVDINGRDIARGEVKEVEANARLVFTFGWEGENHPVPAGSTTVEISLVKDGEGTIVRLRHTDLPSETRGDHREGWQHYLERLLEVAEGRDPGPDSYAESMK